MSTIVKEVRDIQKQARQRDLVETALRMQGQVNVTDAWNGVYGAKIRRLGARIKDLRDDGFQIRTEEKDNGECFYFLISPPGGQMKLI